MTKIPPLLMAAVLLAGIPSAPAQPPTPPPAEPTPAQPTAPTQPPVTNPVPGAEAAQPAVTAPGTETPAPTSVGNDSDTVRLNFKDASLDKVLDYLSEAAGFIIVKKARVTGTVNIVSKQPLTKDEAVELLNTVLNDKGYGAIRTGRTLMIMNKDELKTGGIPVKYGGKAADIPRTDEVVTWVLPVRFVEAAQLLKDLQPLVSVQTPITANESGNSIVITDTQANIHRVAEIVEAIDNGAEDFTVVKVYKLKNADPVETADEITSLFPDDSRSGGSSSPIQFGGGRLGRLFGGGGGAPFGGGFGNRGSGGGNNNSANQRIKKRARVLAVPDPRTSAIIVSAARELMDQIQEVINDLDSDNARKTSVTVFKVPNSDPQQLMSVLNDTFNRNGTQSRNNTLNQQSALTTRSTTQNQLNSSGAQTTINRGGRGGGGGGGLP